jgi:hypothetical protein
MRMTQSVNREIEVREFSIRHQTFVKVRSTPCRRCRDKREERPSHQRNSKKRIYFGINFLKMFFFIKNSFYYLIGGVLFIVKRPILGCAQKPRNSKPTDSVGVDFPPL